MAHVSIRDVDIVYKNTSSGKDFVALSGVSVDVERGEFVTIVGPSGCGKSTLLLSIDGLLKQDKGEILVDGKPVTGPGKDRALVFQEFALMPWRTNESNTWFGMELQGEKKNTLREISDRFLKLVGLKSFAQSYPHQLSGGMRQRVGIARALAVNPDILLMDEPFGALDAQTREIMQSELLKIWEENRKTVFFVTHGIDEAIYLADKIVVMSARPGRVKEIIDVNIPRPRGLEVKETAEFGRLRRHLWQLLEDEVTSAAGWK
ncbi:ABC transporter ATP-binding protein [Bacillus sp. Marseille-P3661]|uniref:ABC transporter ATP-binding protein n=1 Tax=Bacillus sp. Marseille-P3661 TaxID=1936234 RepID=UPI000C83DBB5|nr:ABC transporter ATP-binding protein [Bacillus sp. Marseille-P3661]